MAKDNKKLVQAITSQEENFAQWYTDICVKAELVEYSSVKGFIILRPYGQAIWELIQKDMDARFKATGHENVAMPVLIPESLLQKEGELVNGFAPEVAWVTMGGSDKLEERLAVRPTSETMFCDHWSRVLHSYRELPMKYNQWCSVVRWEKTTRPFLRSREFWWQEGHTIHETAAEAEAETQQQLNCYADVCEQDLAIPVVKGRKTDKEKFAGAEATYTIEAMMKDGKALQSGTSHYFGDKFSKAYDVTFTGRDNQLHHPFQTSWGVSITSPSEELLNFIIFQGWQDIQMGERLAWSDMAGTGAGSKAPGSSQTGAPKPPKAKSSTRRWVCPKCGTIIRSTKDVRVICADCMELFVKAD